MKLVAMTQKEFDHWASRSQKNYAQDKMRANGCTEQEATEIAKNDFLRLLPDGLKSKDSFLFSMKKDDGTTAGYLWLSIRDTAGSRKAFIYDIIVEEHHRGQGLGRKAMLLAEKEAKIRGLREIGLHVFGFNEPAIRLYQSLGYHTTDLVMSKTL